ncbi:M50 family metallopeptidase [Selenihalanaerobacter shriftii]|uniref:Stage IV sporulation protein FB n=1 Tax=Selenihalanaerobacter shriftii TaxID=142842 RepID=A0A1T4PN39_9FIRM|nr:M50 family metallopeptidase [Selenihalanaerobacter shriftii]SJZ92970.1 stage IV sporulation protein FB [Selenihalanaerobacter shriftii]
MYIIKIWGVKIKLNLLFLVVILIFGYFRLLDKALITFGVALLHEISHVIVAKNNNVSIDEIELLPFGGVAKYGDLLELEPLVEIKTALAGPICNLFLAMGMIVALRYSLFSVDWSLFFIRTNLIIAFFNLLPAFPLDGGRILRAVKTEKLGFRQATKLSIKISKYLSIGVGILAIIGLWLGYFNIIILIIAFFIYISASKENKNSIFILMRYLAQKEERLQAEEILRNEELVVIKDAQIKRIIEKFKPKYFHTVVILNQNLDIVATLTEEEIIDGMLNFGINTRVKELI